MRRHPLLFLTLALFLGVSFVPSAVGDDRVRRGGGIVILPCAIRLADCGKVLRERHNVIADGSPVLARLPEGLDNAILVAAVASTKAPVSVSASISGDLLVLPYADLARLEAAGVAEVSILIIGASGDAIDMRISFANRSTTGIFDVAVW